MKSARLSAPFLGRWPRLFTAGICLLLAVASAADAAHGRSRSSRTVSVVVAARSVPAGAALTGRDLRISHWPVRLRPVGTSTRIGSLIGSRIAGRLAPNEAVTSARLMDSRLSGSLRPGWAAIPVVLSDAHTADLVHQGDRVDLLAAPDPGVVSTTSARPSVDEVASRLLVLAVLPADSPTGDAATELILAADHRTVIDITRRRTVEIFTVVVVPP